MKIKKETDQPLTFQMISKTGKPAKQELKEETTTKVTKKTMPYEVVVSDDNGGKYTLFIPDSEMLTYLIDNGFVVEEAQHDFLPFGGKYYNLNDEICTAIMEFFKRKHEK